MSDDKKYHRIGNDACSCEAQGRGNSAVAMLGALDAVTDYAKECEDDRR